jgi:hypothetical protein
MPFDAYDLALVAPLGSKSFGNHVLSYGGPAMNIDEWCREKKC